MDCSEGTTSQRVQVVKKPLIVRAETEDDLAEAFHWRKIYLSLLFAATYIVGRIPDGNRLQHAVPTTWQIARVTP